MGMKLFFWSGLDIGREYSDGYIGVIAANIKKALDLIHSDERDWMQKYYGECDSNEPDILLLNKFHEKEFIWTWG
jgi:hypothetical protein